MLDNFETPTHQPTHPPAGQKSHKSVCGFVHDLSALSGFVHEAPGNPAQRNMVAAITIHQHTHNHMPPFCHSNELGQHSLSPPFSKTVSIPTPCGGAPGQQGVSQYKVAAANTHTHTQRRNVHTHAHSLCSSCPSSAEPPKAGLRKCELASSMQRLTLRKDDVDPSLYSWFDVFLWGPNAYE